jgi:hypothetical protein
MLMLALAMVLSADAPDAGAGVPCKTWRDCSYDDARPPNPVSTKQVKRRFQRKVRPCRDSETDAVCDEETKTCRVVHWKC